MRSLLGFASVLGGLVAVVVVMRSSMDHTRVPRPRHALYTTVDHRAGSAGGGVQLADSATFAPVKEDAQLHGLLVVHVVKGGVADTHFGLLPGDVIVRIGPFEMGDTTLTDFQTACDWVAEAYRRSNMTIAVERHGEELTLPQGDFNDVPTLFASGGADGSSDPSDKSPQITNPGGDE